VESRPQSGFYVRNRAANALVRPSPGFSPQQKPVPVSGRSLMERVYDGLHQPGVVPLGIANPCMIQPAAKALHRAMKRVMSRAEERSLSYSPTHGELALRRQIAYRYLDTVGSNIDPENICITNGGQEALAIAINAVAKKGDIIAVESPTYHGLLELIDSMGMLAIEVETCPEDGVMPESLEKTLATHDVRACMFSTTLSNPLGVGMSESRRQQVVEIIENHDVCLIEDDVYGELRFDGYRPRPADNYSRKGNVITCGSFSKTAAPGYRIGWLVAGRYMEQVKRYKRSLSCSSAPKTRRTFELLARSNSECKASSRIPSAKCTRVG